MPAVAWVGLLSACAVGLVAHYGFRMHALVIYDEKFTVEGARWLHADLHRIFETPGFADRGVERLAPLLVLPLVAVFHSTADQFTAMHVLWALVYALQAVPAFLLARGLGAGTPWGLVAAALSVFGPWAVFGTVLLNNAPAATAAAFALWAMWRAVVTPSARWDALALALLGLAALARVSTVVLAGCLPVAILGQAIRDYVALGAPRENVMRFAGRIARRHWLLLAAVAVALIATGGHLKPIVGQYPVSADVGLDQISEHVMTTIAQLAAGTGVLGAAIGGAWVARQVVRPSAPAAGAFALLALTAFVLLSWVNVVGGFDERYELPLVVPLAVAFAVALGRRELPAVPVAAGALVCWWALHRHAQLSVTLATDYLTWPAREFFSNAWLGGLSSRLSLGRGTLLDLTGALAALAALGVALARGRAARFVHGGAAALVLVAGFAGAGWAMTKLSRFQHPGQAFAGLTFVDEVTGGQRADPLASPVETRSAVPMLWSEVQYFNGSVVHPLSLDSPVYGLCCHGFGDDQVAKIDRATGAVTSEAALPHWILTVPEWLPAGLAARPVFASTARARVETVRVERLREPPLAAWTSEGFDHYGWLRPHAKAVLRVFPAAAAAGPRRCLRATLSAPLLPPGRASRWRIGASAGRLGGAARKRVDVPLHGSAPLDLSVTAAPLGKDPVVGQPGLIGLSDLRVIACGAREPVPRARP